MKEPLFSEWKRFSAARRPAAAIEGGRARAISRRINLSTWPSRDASLRRIVHFPRAVFPACSRGRITGRCGHNTNEEQSVSPASKGNLVPRRIHQSDHVKRSPPLFPILFLRSVARVPFSLCLARPAPRRLAAASSLFPADMHFRVKSRGSFLIPLIVHPSCLTSTRVSIFTEYS